MQIFIGVLIETQPIYIKGLHKRRFRMKNNYMAVYHGDTNRNLSQKASPPLLQSVQRRLEEAQKFVESSNA